MGADGPVGGLESKPYLRQPAVGAWGDQPDGASYAGGRMESPILAAYWRPVILLRAMHGFSVFPFESTTRAGWPGLGLSRLPVL
jgi:hypothetical protein